jgi:outer membrane protein assembly factor BamE (lipoprotein component of BamABCDE complex)
MRMAFRFAVVLAVLTACLGGVACQNPPPAEPAEKLTVGKVQGEIKVGMDAACVAEVLGSPNIVTTDEQRREVWIYDKVSTDRVDTGRSVAGTILILSASAASRESSTTQRTLTIIIKFDEAKKVRDFAYNYSQF